MKTLFKLMNSRGEKQNMVGSFIEVPYCNLKKELEDRINCIGFNPDSYPYQ